MPLGGYREKMGMKKFLNEFQVATNANNYKGKMQESEYTRGSLNIILTTNYANAGGLNDLRSCEHALLYAQAQGCPVCVVATGADCEAEAEFRATFVDATFSVAAAEIPPAN